jgi:two-component system, chemotaxis family, chemotaxis protein CheY
MWTVLLVDDSAEKRFLYSHILKYLGCEVIETPNVALAQMLLNYNTRFDLVITDVHMPVTGGVEFFEWIRAFYPEIPVMMISASPCPPLEFHTQVRQPDYCLFGALNRRKFKHALEQLSQTRNS